MVEGSPSKPSVHPGLSSEGFFNSNQNEVMTISSACGSGGSHVVAFDISILNF